MVTDLKRFLFSYPTILSLLVLVAMGYMLVLYFSIPIRSPLKSVMEKSTEKLIRRNEYRAERRKQLESITANKSTFIKRYRLLATSITNSTEFPLSVENFNTIVVLLSVLSFVVLWFFLENFFLAFLSFFPIVCAIFVTFLKLTKARIRMKDNLVMDTLDLLCPMIDNGVTNAIKKNLERIDRRIRTHFIEFVHNVENLNIHFYDAMDILEERLGPKFAGFASKAKIFEFNEKDGMSKLFMDIVDMNKVNRTINYRMDETFVEINKNMLYSLLIIASFLGFMYVNTLTADTMKNALLGKITTSISISVMIIIYTLNQFIQLDIDFSVIDRENRKAV